jgi:Sodium Bile acid symporter family.
MCPLWPFHVFFIYGSLLVPLWMLSSSVVASVTDTMGSWVVNFDPVEVFLPMDSTSTVKFSTYLQPQEIDVGVVRVTTSDESVANPCPSNKTYILKTESISDFDSWSSAFNVTGNFLGCAEVHLQLINNSDKTVLKQSDPLNVKVVRIQGVTDHLFTYSVAVLVSVIYINFGCALDWSLLKTTIRRPVGPIIGFWCQFLIMPLVSFLFLDEP